jgi:hypothetical protein
LAARFSALTTHYLLEASFARPRTGHDKGGVEARGKGIRWQESVPIPSGSDLRTVSAALLARLDTHGVEKRDAEGRTIADRFAAERARMLQLPGTPCTPSRLIWARLAVKANVGVDEIEVVGTDGRVVVHPRQPFGGRSIDYRHHLPELAVA